MGELACRTCELAYLTCEIVHRASCGVKLKPKAAELGSGVVNQSVAFSRIACVFQFPVLQTLTSAALTVHLFVPFSRRGERLLLRIALESRRRPHSEGQRELE
ncbi:hypothetical protein R1flu_014218 [Riccia fluitans]|uniref:Uncharacterized protein n=1 Tax=Riccia fluitans TaxID=41844 RepID=A0ABD1YIM0_9MARC